MAGRKPKPTALKEVLGNPGHRTISTNEPKPPQGVVLKPKFLKGRAAKIWDEYAPSLAKMGVLTPVDAHQFALWCSLAAEFESGPERMTAARIAQMRAAASSFGLEPSSRSRLKTNGGEESKDPADKYFSGESDIADTEIGPSTRIC